jgi:hypothetical protein
MAKSDMITSWEKTPVRKAASLIETVVRIMLPVLLRAVRVRVGMMCFSSSSLGVKSVYVNTGEMSEKLT